MDYKHTSETLKELAEEFEIRLKREARVDKTVASGDFARGFSVDVVDKSLNVTNLTDYAKAVIEGASPSKTRNDSEGKKRRIERWIKAKGIRPYRKLKRGVKFARTNTERKSALKGAVYAISKAISEKGTIKRFNYSGSNLLERVYGEMESKFKVNLTESYKEDLKTEIRRILKVE